MEGVVYFLAFRLSFRSFIFFSVCAVLAVTTPDALAISVRPFAFFFLPSWMASLILRGMVCCLRGMQPRSVSISCAVFLFSLPNNASVLNSLMDFMIVLSSSLVEVLEEEAALSPCGPPKRGFLFMKLTPLRSGFSESNRLFLWKSSGRRSTGQTTVVTAFLDMTSNGCQIWESGNLGS